MKTTLALGVLLVGAVSLGCGSATVSGAGGKGGGADGGSAGGHAGGGSAASGGTGAGGGASGNTGSGGAAGAGGGASGSAGSGGGAGAGAGGGTGSGGSAGGRGGAGAGGGAGASGGTGSGGSGGAGGAVVTCSPVCNSSTQTCVGTQCLLNNGQSCSLASQCASKVCTPFYVDVDGDGYGAGQAMGFCGSTAPIGYAAMNGDCCDNGTSLTISKLINPGADFQTTSAGGVCGITWDYNCSGALEKSAQAGGCASGSVYPNCTNSHTDYPDSACGMGQGGCSCGVSSQNGGTCIVGCGGSFTLGCR